MPIEFACEACKKLLRVPDGSGGLSCECPSCRTLLEIPDPAAVNVVEVAKTGKDADHFKLRIPCPKCTNELVCAPELLGTRGQCKKCSYIFTISADRESRSNAAAAESVGLVFACPKCEQLFEGKEEMRGRKGKCHACGEVFQIELRVADAPKSNQESVQKPIQRTLANAKKRETRSSPKPDSAKSKSATPEAVIQLACSSCNGVMEVPTAAAGQTTACPHCQLLLHIPSTSRSARSRQPPSRSPPPTATRPASSPKPSATYQPAENSVFGSEPQNDWIELGDMSGAASAYGTPQYASFPPLGHQPPGGYAKRRSARRSPVVYIIPGILMLMCGLGTMLLLVYQMYQLARQWNELQALLSEPRVMAFIVGVVTALALGLLQAVVQILGGIAMIRRVGLSSARVGAIFTCLPCLFCLGINLPLGIWATVVCFSGRPDKDFDF